MRGSRRLGRSESILPAGTLWSLVAIALLATWLALHPGNHREFLAGEDLLRALGPLGVLPLCFWRGANGSGVDRAGRVWLPRVIGMAVSAFVLSRVVAAYLDLVLGHAPQVPSLVDAPLLCSYPFMLLAILLLPTGGRSPVSRIRILLDSLLVVIGSTAFFWYFLIGPSILSEHQSILAKIVSGAYPLWDLVLTCYLILVGGLFWSRNWRPVIVLLAAALAFLIGTDSLRESQIVHGSYSPGGMLDLGRPAAYMLLALAAGATRLVRMEAPPSGLEQPHAPIRLTQRGLPRVWRYLMPYAAVPAMVALMIYVAQTPGSAALALGVYIAGALLIEIVFLHQFLDYRELIAFANKNARLESLAAADPVTGLPNHRAVVSALDLEIARARRYGRPCAILFLDLDHFKALNDSYGHPAGDAALREFAIVVRTCLRGVDMLGRWGGEEFVAVLPETPPDDAFGVADRVRAAVAAHTFWSSGGVHVTCSIGVANFPHDADSRDEMIEMADQAMYAAKRLGRNQVRLAADPAVTTVGNESGRVEHRDEAALIGTVEALAALVDARDHTTGQHVQEVGALAARLALEMGCDTSEAHTAGLAGRLHDIGKIAVPDSILNKQGRLTPEELAVMRKHAAVGAAVVTRVPALRPLAPIIRAQHERWDGAGNPDGLAGDAIPAAARILAVADAYHAMTSDRPYSRMILPSEALSELEQCAGKQFDPRCVAALRRMLEVGVLSAEGVA